MSFNLNFFVNSIVLGVGLSMDAFSVSVANGLNDTKVKYKKIFLIAGIFALFQALMPLIGWGLVHTLLEYFSTLSVFIPWVSLILLSYIGVKMIIDGVKKKEERLDGVTFLALIIQGVATSLDALSVGFTIAEYNFIMALSAVLIIGAVTFIICFAGVIIGKKFGDKLSSKAQVFGGIILILIGIEIFITGII